VIGFGHTAMCVTPVPRPVEIARPEPASALARRLFLGLEIAESDGPSLRHHRSVEVYVAGLAERKQPPVLVTLPPLARHRMRADKLLQSGTRLAATLIGDASQVAGLAKFWRVYSTQPNSFTFDS
jgi:hypothetical protein